MNKYVKNTILVIGSLVIALLIAEGLARIVFDPIDFLKPTTLKDEVLRYKIESNSGAHDSWGYRNKNVPESSEIVAIGDSHTYGVSATASDSWPAQLERISGKSTYNLGLGGYGPAEYFYLMKEQALTLKPEMIVVGLYLGNDLKDSVTAVYSIPTWEELRNPNMSYTAQEKENFEDGSITDWFSSNSVIYRIISSSSLGDQLRQQRRIDRGEDVVMLELPQYSVNTGFTPDRRLKGLDLTTEEGREGLRLTLKFLYDMNKYAHDNNIELLVVIIPTKESVFKDLILESPELAENRSLNKLFQNEDVVNKVIQTFFKDNGISYIDVLNPLRNAAKVEQIYPNNFGGHSNKNGYRIIAESINQYIQSQNAN